MSCMLLWYAILVLTVPHAKTLGNFKFCSYCCATALLAAKNAKPLSHVQAASTDASIRGLFE